MQTDALVRAVSTATAAVGGEAAAHKVDVLAVCPCRVPLLHEGLEQVMVDASPTAAVLELIRRCGLAAWESHAVSPHMLDRLRAAATVAITQADAALHQRGVSVGTELFRCVSGARPFASGRPSLRCAGRPPTAWHPFTGGCAGARRPAGCARCLHAAPSGSTCCWT